MAVHKVKLNTTDNIDVGNTDFCFAVFMDGSKLGTLKISRGAVDWLPTGRSTSHYALSWEELNDLMTEQGHKKTRRS
jgi:hypothetical protein